MCPPPFPVRSTVHTLTSLQAPYHSLHAARSCAVGTAFSTAASTMAMTSGSDPAGCESTREARSPPRGSNARPSVAATASSAELAAASEAHAGSAAARPGSSSGRAVQSAAYSSQYLRRRCERQAGTSHR